MHIPWPVPFFKVLKILFLLKNVCYFNFFYFYLIQSKYDKYEKKSDSYNDDDDDEYEEGKFLFKLISPPVLFFFQLVFEL